MNCKSMSLTASDHTDLPETSPRMANFFPPTRIATIVRTWSHLEGRLPRSYDAPSANASGDYIYSERYGFGIQFSCASEIIKEQEQLSIDSERWIQDRAQNDEWENMFPVFVGFEYDKIWCWEWPNLIASVGKPSNGGKLTIFDQAVRAQTWTPEGTGNVCCLCRMARRLMAEIKNEDTGIESENREMKTRIAVPGTQKTMKSIIWIIILSCSIYFFVANMFTSDQ